jgi:hypothetical protein
VLILIARWGVWLWTSLKRQRNRDKHRLRLPFWC